jgi:hypothetical protein
LSTPDDTPTRPWFFSPLPPFVLGVLSIVALLHDGTTPFEILWREHTWEKVRAEPTKVSRPVRRVTTGAGVAHAPSAFVEGKKTRFGVQEEQALGSQKAGSSSGPARTVTRSEIIERKVTPKRIHSKVVEKGTLFPYKVKRWYVKLAFQYDYKGKPYRVYEDTPSFTFESHEKARAYLKERIGKWPIKVWVNPSQPNEATAFLDYRGWHWIQLGGFFLALSVIWLLVAVSVMARTEHGGDERATDEPAQAETEKEWGPDDRA